MTKTELDQLRAALSDYIRSEGCDCCRDVEKHRAALKHLGALLKVEPDADGWCDFYQFKRATEGESAT